MTEKVLLVHTYLKPWPGECALCVCRGADVLYFMEFPQNPAIPEMVITPHFGH